MAVPAVRPGRIYNPPLQTRPQLFRRGRCPHRPARPRVQGSPLNAAGVGAAISRPNRPPISALPPSNAVGRHAHMPPRPGCDDRGPWRFRRCVPGGFIIRTYRPAPGLLVGADAHIGPLAPCARQSAERRGRRGGYQSPEPAPDSRRTPVERRRAACPHAATTGLR